MGAIMDYKAYDTKILDESNKYKIMKEYFEHSDM